jgi:hypothetical protein
MSRSNKNNNDEMGISEGTGEGIGEVSTGEGIGEVITGEEFTPEQMRNETLLKIASVFIPVFVMVILLHFILTRFTNFDWFGYLGIIILFVCSVILFMIFVRLPNPRKYYLLSIYNGDDKRLHNMTSKDSRPSDYEVLQKFAIDRLEPYIGSTPIEVSGKTHIFLGGYFEHNDQLLVWNDVMGKFNNVILDSGLDDKTSDDSTLSAMSIDLDGNGKQDLIVGRKKNVCLYKQMSDGKFVKEVLYNNPKNTIPLAISVSDFNKDGRPDIYVSNFTEMKKFRGAVFNDPSHNKDNILLQGVKKTGIDNNKEKYDIKFKNVTSEMGAKGKSNTFTSAWVDLDKDGFPDLVLAHDSSEVEILRNRGINEKNGEHLGFESIIPYEGKGNYMGLGVGDIDHDGDMDLFFTNIGVEHQESVGKSAIVSGDLRKDQAHLQKTQHILLRNDGNFKFTEIGEKTGIDGKGFGWGAIIEDLNMDGKMDILFGTNFMMYYLSDLLGRNVGYYYKWIGLNRDGMPQYKREFKYLTSSYNQTPMLVDTQGDNVKDVVWVNMAGRTQIQLRDTSDLDGNFLNVKLPENTDFVNAKVVIELGNGKVMYNEVIQGGVGFGGDQENVISFGLGEESVVKEVRVHRLDGKIYKVSNPNINSTLTLRQLGNSEIY